MFGLSVGTVTGYQQPNSRQLVLVLLLSQQWLHSRKVSRVLVDNLLSTCLRKVRRKTTERPERSRYVL